MLRINLYDFDNTIYEGDSSVDFVFYSIKKYPKIIRRIPCVFLAAIRCKAKSISKTQMKETIFSFLQDIPDIDSHLQMFWKTHEKNIKEFYLQKNHDQDIIISASPEFLLKPIMEKLKPYDMMASKVDKKTGLYDGDNCHGEEKVRRLNEKYKDYEVMESFSDSKSDIPILRLAKKQYLVKGKELKEVHF